MAPGRFAAQRASHRTSPTLIYKFFYPKKKQTTVYTITQSGIRSNSGMSQLRTLIFDVDGTLVDTEEVHRQAFNLAFLDFDLGWQWTPHLYSELLAISGGLERIHCYATHLGKAAKKTDNFNEFVLRVHQRKSAHYARLISSGEVPLRPGVKRLLNEALEQDIKLAIATSTSMVNVKTLLDNRLPRDWPSWFEVVATADTIAKKKPSPDVYHFVLNVLAEKPQHCIAIEDTESGNTASLQAGITTVITLHALTRGSKFPGASLVVDHLGEPGLPMTIFSSHSQSLSTLTHVDMELLKGILNVARPCRHKADPCRAPCLGIVE